MWDHSDGLKVYQPTESVLDIWGEGDTGDWGKLDWIWDLSVGYFENDSI